MLKLFSYLLLLFFTKFFLNILYKVKNKVLQQLLVDLGLFSPIR